MRHRFQLDVHASGPAPPLAAGTSNKKNWRTDGRPTIVSYPPMGPRSRGGTSRSSASRKEVPLDLLDVLRWGQWSCVLPVAPQAFPMALFAYNPGVKPRAAAEVKALASYGPAEGGRRHRHLLDLARLSLVFGSCEMLQLGLDSVLRQFKVLGVRNLFRCPSRSLVWTRRVEARPATVQEGTKTLFPNPPWLGIRFE
ncbi:unnamed protein product [Prorocentrum cordatum]|uniref:RNA-directed RNA polymerase n=1 Tax=Prorocentrum cordatum TaxID=2364126 RepID=A0ABN9QWX3_9DINO|nr:unnamed protein product [Polarella glacialis]